MFKSEIHRTYVVEDTINYEGSITIDKELMKQAGTLLFERIRVFNINNDTHFVIYAIEVERNGVGICQIGAAAQLALTGDITSIIT